ncbi:MAG: metal-dependent transcriptional regulator, partial [Caldisericia bacterium]
MELTESLQDYLLEIYIVKTKKAVVRLKDIAKRRNVKLPSVVSAIKELVKRGLVAHEHYGYIEFTDAGIDEAT